MRYLFAALVLAAAVCGTAAQAEKRTFIVANNSDGYGVDRCLATGASCGAPWPAPIASPATTRKRGHFARSSARRSPARCRRPPALPPATSSSPSSACAEAAPQLRRDAAAPITSALGTDPTTE